MKAKLKTKKVFPSCEHCGSLESCFTADYVVHICTLFVSLFWPNDRDDWPFEPVDIMETLHRNIAAHCKSFTKVEGEEG